MRKKMHAYVFKNWVRETIDLHIVETNLETGERFLMTNAMFQKMEEAQSLFDIDDPVRLRMEEAQELMNELWNAGLRPHDVRDINDVVSAKDKHIDDLRKVLDGFLRMVVK
jgi:hypothetical protein